MNRLAQYIVASTENPTGRRPWDYKLSAYDPRARYLSAYYRAHFAVPNPNEVGQRLDGFLSGRFYRPGGISQTRWASRDNFNAPLPVYGAPELIPGHYGNTGLGITTRVIDGQTAPRAVGPIVYNAAQNSPQPITLPAPVPQTTLPQPTLTPATVSSIPTAAVSSSGQPMSSQPPASTVATPASGSSVSDLLNQAMTWLQSKSLISAVPNYVPVAGLAFLLFSMSDHKGRR